MSVGSALTKLLTWAKDANEEFRVLLAIKTILTWWLGWFTPRRGKSLEPKYIPDSAREGWAKQTLPTLCFCYLLLITVSSISYDLMASICSTWHQLRWLEAEGFTFTMASSRAWQTGADCELGAQPGLWARGLSSFLCGPLRRMLEFPHSAVAGLPE